MKYSDIAGLVIDMDGVLWRDSEPLPGLVELFEWLDESGTPYVLATNNSTNSPARYVAKLAGMGVDGVPVERIITSGTATATYMQRRYPAGTPVHVFGMDSLRQIIEAAGFDISDEEPAQVVVAGGNFDTTYDMLKRATLALRAGADFIGTNPDTTFPTPEGLVPGAGSLIAALEAASDRQATIIGKPAAPMFEAALEVLGTSKAQTVMLGDRLNTDIVGAHNAGLRSVMLFSGVTQPDELTSANNDIWPDVALDGLPELLRAWAGDDWYREKLKARRGR